jgi:hypothetical protein
MSLRESPWPTRARGTLEARKKHFFVTIPAFWPTTTNALNSPTDAHKIQWTIGRYGLPSAECELKSDDTQL